MYAFVHLNNSKHTDSIDTVWRIALRKPWEVNEISLYFCFPLQIMWRAAHFPVFKRYAANLVQDV